MKISFIAIAVAAFIVSSGISHTAMAQTAEKVPATASEPIETVPSTTLPPTFKNFEVSFSLGNIFNDNLQFGMGLRTGYTLPSQIYLGFRFHYHFGQSADAKIDTLGFSYNTGGKVFSGEIGYTMPMRSGALIRPTLGIGMTQINSDIVIKTESSAGTIESKAVLDESGLTFIPGLTAQFPLEENIHLGAMLQYSLAVGGKSEEMSGVGLNLFIGIGL